MGTNYYWHYREMFGGEVFTELHIGKQSGGWVFSLEGHFEPESPVSITSWAEWKDALRSGGSIWDEYGVQHEVEGFIADVEASRLPDTRLETPRPKLRQYDWMKNHPRPYFDQSRLDKIEPYGDWLDADGFSFHGGDFS